MEAIKEDELTLEKIKERTDSIKEISSIVSKEQFKRFKQVLKDSTSPLHLKAQSQSKTIKKDAKIDKLPIYRILEEIAPNATERWSEGAEALIDLVKKVQNQKTNYTFLMTGLIKHLSAKSLLAVAIASKNLSCPERYAIMAEIIYSEFKEATTTANPPLRNNKAITPLLFLEADPKHHAIIQSIKSICDEIKKSISMKKITSSIDSNSNPSLLQKEKDDFFKKIVAVINTWKLEQLPLSIVLACYSIFQTNKKLSYLKESSEISFVSQFFLLYYINNIIIDISLNFTSNIQSVLKSTLTLPLQLLGVTLSQQAKLINTQCDTDEIPIQKSNKTLYTITKSEISNFLNLLTQIQDLNSDRIAAYEKTLEVFHIIEYFTQNPIFATYKIRKFQNATPIELKDIKKPQKPKEFEGLAWSDSTYVLLGLCYLVLDENVKESTTIFTKLYNVLSYLPIDAFIIPAICFFLPANGVIQLIEKLITLCEKKADLTKYPILFQLIKYYLNYNESIKALIASANKKDKRASKTSPELNITLKIINILLSHQYPNINLESIDQKEASQYIYPFFSDKKNTSLQQSIAAQLVSYLSNVDSLKSPLEENDKRQLLNWINHQKDQTGPLHPKRLKFLLSPVSLETEELKIDPALTQAIEQQRKAVTKAEQAKNQTVDKKVNTYKTLFKIEDKWDIQAEMIKLERLRKIYYQEGKLDTSEIQSAVTAIKGQLAALPIGKTIYKNTSVLQIESLPFNYNEIKTYNWPDELLVLMHFIQNAFDSKETNVNRQDVLNILTIGDKIFSLAAARFLNPSGIAIFTLQHLANQLYFIYDSNHFFSFSLPNFVQIALQLILLDPAVFHEGKTAILNFKKTLTSNLEDLQKNKEDVTVSVLEEMIKKALKNANNEELNAIPELTKHERITAYLNNKGNNPQPLQDAIQQFQDAIQQWKLYKIAHKFLFATITTLSTAINNLISCSLISEILTEILYYLPKLVKLAAFDTKILDNKTQFNVEETILTIKNSLLQQIFDIIMFSLYDDFANNSSQVNTFFQSAIFVPFKILFAEFTTSPPPQVLPLDITNPHSLLQRTAIQILAEINAQRSLRETITKIAHIRTTQAHYPKSPKTITKQISPEMRKITEKKTATLFSQLPIALPQSPLTSPANTKRSSLTKYFKQQRPSSEDFSKIPPPSIS